MGGGFRYLLFSCVFLFSLSVINLYASEGDNAGTVTDVNALQTAGEENYYLSVLEAAQKSLEETKARFEKIEYGCSLEKEKVAESEPIDTDFSDLSVQGIETKILDGKHIQLGFVVENAGDRNIEEDFGLKIFLGDRQAVSTFFNGGLEAHKPIDLPGFVISYESGDLPSKLKVEVDPDNVIPEPNENNNIAQIYVSMRDGRNEIIADDAMNSDGENIISELASKLRPTGETDCGTASKRKEQAEEAISIVKEAVRQEKCAVSYNEKLAGCGAGGCDTEGLFAELKACIDREKVAKGYSRLEEISRDIVSRKIDDRNAENLETDDAEPRITRFEITKPSADDIKGWNGECELEIEGENLEALNKAYDVYGIILANKAGTERRTAFILNYGYVKITEIRNSKATIVFPSRQDRFEAAKGYEGRRFEIECRFSLLRKGSEKIEAEDSKTFTQMEAPIDSIRSERTIPDILKTGLAKNIVEGSHFPYIYRRQDVTPATHAISIFRIYHSLKNGQELLKKGEIKIDVVGDKGKTIMKSGDVSIQVSDQTQIETDEDPLMVSEIEISVRFFRHAENAEYKSKAEKTLKEGETYTILISDKNGNALSSDSFRVIYDEADASCAEIGKDASDGGFDISFIGFGYSDLDSFRDDVLANRDYFLSAEPMKSNSRLFDFYYDTYPYAIEVDANGFERSLQLECPNTHVVNLIKNEVFQSHVIRGSKEARISVPNSNIQTFVHETGHLLGVLGDEYITVPESAPNDPDMERRLMENRESNCVPDKKTAETGWGDLEGLGEGGLKVGYFSGCGRLLPRFIRPSENSIMRNHWEFSQEDVERGYGPANERFICRDILKTRGGICTEYYRLCLETQAEEDCEKWYR